MLQSDQISLFHAYKNCDFLSHKSLAIFNFVCTSLNIIQLYAGANKTITAGVISHPLKGAVLRWSTSAIEPCRNRDFWCNYPLVNLAWNAHKTIIPAMICRCRSPANPRWNRTFSVFDGYSWSSEHLMISVIWTSTWFETGPRRAGEVE